MQGSVRLKAFVTLASPQPPDASLNMCGDLIDLVVRDPRIIVFVWYFSPNAMQRDPR